eukprot:3475272-Alexandrium_andersonii.AAC.1
MGIDLAAGGLGGVDGVITDHRGSSGAFAVSQPKQCFTDATKLSGVVAGHFSTKKLARRLVQDHRPEKLCM